MFFPTPCFNVLTCTNHSLVCLVVQDKWRNLSVTAGGYGSREKARMALKKGRRVVPKLTAEPMDVDANGLDNVHDAVIDAEPLAMSVEPLALEESPEKSVARLVDLMHIFYQSGFLFSLQVIYVFRSPGFILVNMFYGICGGAARYKC